MVMVASLSCTLVVTEGVSAIQSEGTETPNQPAHVSSSQRQHGRDETVKRSHYIDPSVTTGMRVRPEPTSTKDQGRSGIGSRVDGHIGWLMIIVVG